MADVVLTGEPDELPPLERLFYLLDWPGGSFELADAEQVLENKDAFQISYALLEHARRRDEGR